MGPEEAPARVRPPARPAFYALAPGGWRDYVTLLHVPYTAWHLSYVALGAATASTLDLVRLGASLLGFFLGVGVCAHALDELNGRPLGTRIPRGVLWALAVVGLGGAVALGVAGALEVSLWLLPFVGFGAFIVFAYNLELFGGRFHSDAWFALSWGAFPALTGSFAQAGTLRAEGLLVAAGCLLLSLVQRRLSTPVRWLRRKADRVEGRVLLRDGSAAPLDEAALRRAPEAALRALALALPVLATGLVLARLR
ncbi:MAG TPA: hypothetical protein VNO34_04105 [Actinomycetota bacterium]|nr:hypothetical protein [Actinomycetota bacterium]